MTKYLLVALMALGLVACGQSKSDRAISGAGLGAAAGAGTAAVMNGDPLTGAAIGGAVGAAGGALTNQRDIDLGKPIWR